MCLPLFCRYRQVGDYRLGEVIGKGTFATVRRGIHQPSGKVVALKIFGPGTEHLFAQEVGALSQLKHPNIIGVDAVDGRARYEQLFGYKLVQVLSLELAACSVEELLVCGPLTPATAQSLMIQLLKALAFCHSKGVFHRDVKPANLLLTPNNTLLLSDFNCASTRRVNRVRCGSPIYMAPEVRQMKSYDGSRVDVWGAGLCFFEFLVGAPPFVTPLRSDSCYQLVHKGRWDKYWEVHPMFKGYFSPLHMEVLMSATTVDPSARPSAKKLLEYF